MGELQTTDTGQALALRSTGSTAVDLAPAEKSRRAQFSAIMLSCLTLASGATHTREARREWLAAADVVLGDVGPKRLADAAKIAMRRADHPSKIVPAIQAELDAQAVRDRADQLRRSAIAETQALMADAKPRADAGEVAELVREMAAKWGAKHG